MDRVNRYYYIRNLTNAQILPGIACQALEQALGGHEIADDYEHAIIRAMADCHSRQMELVISNAAYVMFNPETDNDHLLISLHESYRNHIQDIIRPAMQENHAENVYGLAINACARYVNIATRIAIANGRRKIPAIMQPHSEALTRALEQSDVTTRATPDENAVHFINMQRDILVYTAHYINPDQIPDNAYADAARYAIRIEYGQ